MPDRNGGGPAGGQGGGDAMLQPRYSGVPTFMRAPLAADPRGLDIALVLIQDEGETSFAIPHKINRPAGVGSGCRRMRGEASDDHEQT